MLRKIISLVLSFGLLFQQVSFAQVAVELNLVDYLSIIGSNIVQDKFRPPHLRYFSYDSLNDNFEVLLDKGDIKNSKTPELENSTKALLSYFLIGVTLPDEMFWVNLRPDSEDQTIDPWLEKTDVGKIMLEADLQLKKDTALFTSSQTPEGREYWDNLYKKAADLYGYDNVTISTLTRPWIVPGEIIVRESKDSAYVYKAILKVMLEQDYLKDSATYNFKDERSKALNEYSSQLIRELIIPKLTKEVNSSKRYAALRQVYYSLILSRWFKLRFTGKTGTYASLINSRNLTNLTSQEPWIKTTYFKQYQKSFQDGEYNIKESVYTPTGQVIRSYFSGGINVTSSAINTQNGIIVANDNAKKLGDVIGGKAIVDPQNINLQPAVVSSPITPPVFKDHQNSLSYSEMVNSYSNDRNNKKTLSEDEVKPDRKKFHRETLAAESFSGNTVIENFDSNTNEKLKEIKQKIKKSLEENGLGSKVAFVQDGSFHLTIYDLINPDDLPRIRGEEPEYVNKTDDEIRTIVIQKISEAFQELKNEGILDSIVLKIRRLGTFAPFLLLALAYPNSDEDLAKINTVRRKIFEKTKIRSPFPFVAHVTLGYIVNPMDEREYAAYKEIVNTGMKDMDFEVSIDFMKMELSDFPDMNKYNKVFDAENAIPLRKDVVLDITDSKSSEISLVGGKAASLKELGSIPGVNVPKGFNVTTHVYAYYLEKVGAWPYISELEKLSWQWKRLEENNSDREDLTNQMRQLSEKIRGLILNGKIPDEIQQLILASYKKLETDGQPALVAVRSSATAEDMPGASFAGQYTTYLNQQGDDQVIGAIKRVWASTYNMNAIEYRNKQNMQHSKNMMCALVLEMVNPQSAGTAFSVDLETGAPFISVNNTYGLGEAEVAGIVSSDTWIVDPSTGDIIKRRLGEKGKKIVYDVDKKTNVTVDTSNSERRQFAISQTMAKKVALLVKRIQDHYVKKNPNLNHMDVEYAITHNGRIIFTQARPETVWTSGSHTLIAVAKNVEEENAKAMKMGKAPLYPEIFKGGVSGATGVARGVLRVMATVAEAEEFVKPGDIMVAPNTTNAWEHVMGRASGIITEIGGPGNHTAVVSREQKKAAIVGAVGAMQSLRMYEGRMVTVDATSKRVYLNNVPQELEYSPDKIPPIYGTLFSQTLDESWDEAQDTMTTTTDMVRVGRWINKPNQPVRVFLQQVFTRSHQWVANQLNPGQPFRDRISKEGKYQVNFDDIFPWMERLAEKPLEGPDSLSSIHEARAANVRDFLEKSEGLILNTTSVKAWIDSFITLNGFMGYAYNMYRITEGLMQDALSKKHIPEPYLSQVWISMAAWIGETEAVERTRDYGYLLERVKDDDALRRDLKLTVEAGRGFDEFAISHPEFYSKFNDHAFNYKIIKNTDDIFTSATFHYQLAEELLKDAADQRTITIYNAKPEQFYPDDAEFTRIARLAFFSSKLRQDAHHFKVRGQWKFVEILQPLSKFLIEKREIKTFGDIFDHTPEWILEKVSEYEKAGLPAVAGKSAFHVNLYEIQDLIIKDDVESANEDIDDAMLTSMGRWKFESVKWDEINGRLTLANAMRIETIVKPEFLEQGGASPKEIILSTRKLNEREYDKINGLAGSLKMDINKIIVIKLDRAAAFNRIYGLYANGVSFIREDILSEGSQDQIHEALDHLRLKPTGLGYEDLKDIQYHGDLRSLITKLSHKTIKEKLLFELYSEEETLRIINGSAQESIKDAIVNAILKQLGDKRSEYQEQVNRLQSDEIFYDQVTREMVRNKVEFVGAVDIVNKMNGVLTRKQNQESISSPISSSNVGGIDFRTLPMTIQPMGSFSGLNFKLPQLSQAALQQINIKEEIQQIKNMAQAGIMPSGERVKELVAACVQKGEINSLADNLLLCLVDILKLEEENASESSSELREALVIVDSQS